LDSVYQDITGNQIQQQLSNKSKRFNCYRDIAKELGYRQRRALPKWIVEALRDLFTDVEE
jgi:hypothetical protein